MCHVVDFYRLAYEYSSQIRFDIPHREEPCLYHWPVNAEDGVLISGNSCWQDLEGVWFSMKVVLIA